MLGTTWRKLLKMNAFFNEHSLNVIESDKSVEQLRRQIHNRQNWHFKEIYLQNKKTTTLIRKNVSELIKSF